MSSSLTTSGQCEIINKDLQNDSSDIIEGSTHIDESISEATDHCKNKINLILNHLFETEKFYVRDLLAVLEGYKDASKLEYMQPFLPEDAEEKIPIIFGNLDELSKFHSEQFLVDLTTWFSSSEGVASSFIKRKWMFYQLYSSYCLNLPKSEQLRENSPNLFPYFQVCQQQLGHRMPLAAYLLRPVQRLTEYQLILTDLLKYSKEQDACVKIQEALDCILKVLKAVNDRLYQRSISGLYLNLSQQGELLLQGSLLVWSGHKLLSIKPKRRYLFLYQEALLFCKTIAKAVQNNTHQFKHYLPMSKVGLTERVKDDIMKFEVWSEGRREVYILQAPNLDVKLSWINEIKKVLLKQLHGIRKRLMKERAPINYVPLPIIAEVDEDQEINKVDPTKTIQSETVSKNSDNTQAVAIEDDTDSTWSTGRSNSEDEECNYPSAVYIASYKYRARGKDEVNIDEGDIIELLHSESGGWWYVRVIGNNQKGWAPGGFFRELCQ